VRLLFFSNVYPTPLEPTKGVFNRVLVEELRRGHDVRVVAPVPWPLAWRAGHFNSGAGDPCFPVFYYLPGVLRHHFDRFLWASVRKPLRRIVRDFSPEVVLAYWTHPDGAVAARMAREAGVPSVLIVGGSDILLLTADKARRQAMVRVLKEVDSILAVGKGLRQALLALGIPAEKVRVLRRSVDSRVFHPGPKDEARERLGLPAEGRLVVWAGRMVPVKGLDILLEAWRQYISKDREGILCLVGSGPLRRSLEGRVAAEGLEGRVRFVGAVEPGALGDWYRAADLTVLPSRSEGIPNVLLESLACGTPFLASRVGGIAELTDLPDRDLVPPEDPVALALGLARRLESSDGLGPAVAPALGEPVAEVMAAIADAQRSKKGARD
jgi:teichuronic acid biosynthesis glycosyltransferase TuaC